MTSRAPEKTDLPVQADDSTEYDKVDDDVRPAVLEDVELLPHIQQESRKLFLGTAHQHVLDRPTIGLDYLREALEKDHLWVATDDTKAVVGFAVAEDIGDRLHLEQISVLPEAGGNGLGRKMVVRVKEYAKEHEYPGVTLVTYADIPWNQPFYEKLGFQVRPLESLAPAMQHVMVEDAEAGFDASKRVFMEAAI